MRIPSACESSANCLARLPEEVLPVLLAAAALPELKVAMSLPAAPIGKGDSTACRLPRVQRSSRSTVPRGASPIRCSDPSATSARLPGSVARSTCGSLLRARISSRARVDLALGTEGPDQRVARELDEAAQHVAERAPWLPRPSWWTWPRSDPRRPRRCGDVGGRRCARSPRRRLRTGDCALRAVLIQNPDGLDLLMSATHWRSWDTCSLPARAALVEEAIEHAWSDEERAGTAPGLAGNPSRLLGDAEAPSTMPVKVLSAPSPWANWSRSPS